MYLFHNFKIDAPLIIYAILMNKNLRNLFLNKASIKSELMKTFTLTTQPKLEKFIDIFLSTEFSEAIFGENKEDVYELDENKKIKLDKDIQEHISLHTFNGMTDGYWKNLEVAKTKVMIISIPQGTYITSPDKPKEELSAEDVNGNFLILDGLLYKSNTEQNQIIYMEV